MKCGGGPSPVERAHEKLLATLEAAQKVLATFEAAHEVFIATFEAAQKVLCREWWT